MERWQIVCKLKSPVLVDSADPDSPKMGHFTISLPTEVYSMFACSVLHWPLTRIADTARC